jgi:hypothetical protein
MLNLYGNYTLLRPKLQEALDFFSGSTVYVVGGGNSYTNDQYNLIRDKTIVALNSTFIKIPEAKLIYWMDCSWPCNHLHELESHNATFRFQSKDNASYQIKHNTIGLGGALYLNRSGNFGFSQDINSVYGNNSGTQAINLLVNLNVKKIVLLGFDMQRFMGKTHHHDHYTHNVTQDVYDEMFIPSMNALVSNMKNKKTKIINCSPVTRLKCFEQDDLINHI